MDEERLKFLVTLNDRLRPLRDPVEIQDVAASLLGDHLRLNRVIYGDIDGDEFIVGRTYVNGVAPFAGRGRIADFGTALVDAYMRGETVAVNDVLKDERLTDADRAVLARGEIAAFIVTTLHKDGRWVGGFAAQREAARLDAGRDRARGDNR